MEWGNFKLPLDTKVPDHVAIIPDGNRRWARARGKPTFFGHKNGFDLLPKLVDAGRKMGIHTMTFWAFSTENWDRGQDEINYLMKMYELMIGKNLKSAHKHESQIVHLGRKDRIPKSLANKIDKAEKETKNYQKYILNIALDYGGHDEISRAIKKMVEDIEKNKVKNPWDKITGKYGGKYPIYGLADYLDTAHQPYPFPDLMIRTSGEHRTSGLLTWQSAYSEYYFVDFHFPDFDEQQLLAAVLEYSRRRRRFGGDDADMHLNFQPDKIGKLESESWQAYHKGDFDNFTKLFVKKIRDLYNIKNGLADRAGEKMLMAQKYYDQKKYILAQTELSEYFDIIKQATKFAFDPEKVSELEINAKKMIEQSQTDGNTLPAKALLLESVAEEYRINKLQANKSTQLKLLALKEIDTARKTNDKKHWKYGEDYLVRSYRALKEMVA